MISYNNRAIIILAAYDFESLQITLRSLSHTISRKEKVIIILNGKRSLYGELVERIAREWVTENPQKRFIFRPLHYGNKPLYAIMDTLENCRELVDVDYICKIDDDIIPVNRGWIDSFSTSYEELSQKEDVGFISGLINNNTWGFKELVDIYDKKDEYCLIMNGKSISGTGIVEAGEIADGFCGSVWHYPYLAWWIHQWTSLQIDTFVEKTSMLKWKKIPNDTNYSIDCIFSEKKLWFELDSVVDEKIKGIDETIINKLCSIRNLSKTAILSEPVIHLFYFIQRLVKK